MNIDISSINLNNYSSDELIGYADKGLLFAGQVDLSELVERLLQDRDAWEEKFTQNDIDEAHREGYSDGVGACMAAIENL